MTSLPPVPVRAPGTIVPAAEFESMLKLAEIFSRTKMVPAHFQGKPDDCFVAIQMAQRMGVDPMMALQNVYVVGGKPGLSGALVISLINNSGKLKGRVGFRVEGKAESLAVTAHGTLASTGEEVEFTASMAMAKAEGWDKNPKYRSMPEVMLRYRAATFLARFNFPEVILGMHSSDEWEDVEASANATVQRTAVAASAAGTALLAAKRPVATPPAEATPEAEPASARIRPPVAPTPPPPRFRLPDHAQMVTDCLNGLEVGPEDRARLTGKLRDYLATRTLLATREGVESAVRGFFELEGYVPPADLPTEGEEA